MLSSLPITHGLPVCDSSPPVHLDWRFTPFGRRLQTQPTHTIINSVFNYIRTLKTWHCPHLLLCAVLRPRTTAAPAVQQSIDISLPAGPTAANPHRTLLQRVNGTDRRTDTVPFHVLCGCWRRVCEPADLAACLGCESLTGARVWVMCTVICLGVDGGGAGGAGEKKPAPPVRRRRASSSTTELSSPAAPRLTERQQLALLLQMTAEKRGSSSTSHYSPCHAPIHQCSEPQIDRESVAYRFKIRKNSRILPF